MLTSCLRTATRSGREVAASFTAISAYSFMIFNLLCAPCFAAMGAIKREMNNGKWTAIAIGYMCLFAYCASLVVYQIGGLITGEVSFNIFTVVAIAIVAFDHLPAVPSQQVQGRQRSQVRREKGCCLQVIAEGMSANSSERSDFL